MKVCKDGRCIVLLIHNIGTTGFTIGKGPIYPFIRRMLGGFHPFTGHEGP